MADLGAVLEQLKEEHAKLDITCWQALLDSTPEPIRLCTMVSFDLPVH